MKLNNNSYAQHKQAKQDEKHEKTLDYFGLLETSTCTHILSPKLG